MTLNSSPEVPVWVWGLPFAPLTLAQTVESVDALVEQAKPAFFITANTHYAMLTREMPDLRPLNACAAFIVADGAPLVRATRGRPVPLPERVAGSDLIFEISELAARKGYRIFLAGGGPGVADLAAQRLKVRYANLQVAGTATPSFRAHSSEEYQELKTLIRNVAPHILIIAATMPFGERWLHTHLSDLEVPVGVNLGAALDFAAGRITRAPRWMQKLGLEWAFRLMMEPRRLFSRYVRNAWFILRMALSQPPQVPTSP
jgi:N-acetylglucosaminyldiphosphoundecaprenol N-acetyl-beta-D-mannosaminyltransferase